MGSEVDEIPNKKVLRKFVDDFGVHAVFTLLEEIAYDRDVEEHKKDPNNTDYYWPGVIGIARKANERLRELKGEFGRI
jgi:hypothetical protein